MVHSKQTRLFEKESRGGPCGFRTKADDNGKYRFGFVQHHPDADPHRLPAQRETV